MADPGRRLEPTARSQTSLYGMAPVFLDRSLRFPGVFEDSIELVLSSFTNHFAPLERREEVYASIDALDLDRIKPSGDSRTPRDMVLTSISLTASGAGRRACRYRAPRSASRRLR